MARKHVIGTLTAGVLALAAGTAHQQGMIPHWEGFTNPRKVNGEIVSVAIHQSFDPKGVITVCAGHTNLDDPNLKPGDVYTAVMCSKLLEQDLPKYNAMLASCLPADFMVSDHQHVSFLSFTYNLGKGSQKRHNGFCYSSVGVNLRASYDAEKSGNHAEAVRLWNKACDSMGAFTRANSVVLPGLERRRYDKLWGEIAWCKKDED